MSFGLGFNLGLGEAPMQAAQGAAWHPDDYFTGWDAYFIAEAADVGSPGDGNAVAAWANRGAGDLSWRQGTGDSQPLWRAGIAELDNRPAVDFDGTDDFMVGRNGADSAAMTWAAFGVSASAKSVVMVLLPDASGTDGTTAGANDTIITNPTGLFAVALRGSGATKAVLVSHFDGTVDAASHAIVYGSPLLVVVRHASGAMFTSTNGGAETETATGNLTNTAVQPYLGNDSGADNNMNAKLAFIAAIDDGNPANLATAIANLKAYYGIA